MLTIKQEKEVLVIVLHEIYGINNHMKTMAEHLVKLGFDVMIPNLIGRAEPFSHREEQQAYKHFMEAIGFDAAFSLVNRLVLQLRNNYKEIHIIGFSIGATIAWRCSEIDGVTAVTGFYGSRIRDYLEIEPACPVLLIYGEEEQSFDVQAAISQLGNKDTVLVNLPGKHGFADPYAPSYHFHSHHEAIKLMENFHKHYSDSLC